MPAPKGPSDEATALLARKLEIVTTTAGRFTLTVIEGPDRGAAVTLDENTPSRIFVGTGRSFGREGVVRRIVDRCEPLSGGETSASNGRASVVAPSYLPGSMPLTGRWRFEACCPNPDSPRPPIPAESVVEAHTKGD